MPRSYKIIGFILVTLLGIYGCAKGPGSTSKDSSSNSAKVQRLEDDYRAAVAARDQFRTQLAATEEQHAKVQTELERTRAAAAAERDALKGEVKARTAERDALLVQYETFRKNLKDLLGHADAAVGALNLPAPKPPADQGARK
jgi:septal ring factor EnvC (AmiA/AmiB activator)